MCSMRTFDPGSWVTRIEPTRVAPTHTIVTRPNSGLAIVATEWNPIPVPKWERPPSQLSLIRESPTCPTERQLTGYGGKPRG
jgi:hypothetical protein